MKPNMEKVRALIAQKGWSGSQLALHMGVSRTEANRLLTGKRVGGKKCIGGLIKAFPSVPIDQLFFLK